MFLAQVWRGQSKPALSHQVERVVQFVAVTPVDFTLVKISSVKGKTLPLGPVSFRVERQRLRLVVIRDVLLPGENVGDPGATARRCWSCRMDCLLETAVLV